MIHVVGIDAAFANMGFARAQVRDDVIQCTELHLCSTDRQDRKVVRKSSDDLRRAIELKKALQDFCQYHHGFAGATKPVPQLAFVEVPTGAQSAAAAWSLGIATGVLASCPVPIIEVSPTEVKNAVRPGTRGTKGPTKDEIIEWAIQRWPDAPWLRDKKGKPLKANEHLADALAIICAGIKTPAFLQLLSLTSHETPRAPGLGSAPDRQPRPRVPLEPLPVARQRVRLREG